MEGRNDLITSCMDIADSVARKYQHRMDYDDLYSEATLGIIYAVDQCVSGEITYKNPRPYIYKCAKGYALSAIKQNNKSGAHIPRSTYNQVQEGLSFDELVESGKTEERARQILNAAALVKTSSIFVQDSDGDESQIEIEDREESTPDFCMADLEPLLEKWVRPREAQVLRMKYGVNCLPMKPSEIAESLGITVPKVGKIAEEATYKISRVRECKHCGDTFERGQHLRRYCSPNCYHAFRRQKDIVPCKHCGKDFLKKHGRLFCAEECCNDYWREKYRIRGKLVCFCEWCGHEFKSNRTRGYQVHRFCCKKCWNEYSYDEQQKEKPYVVARIEERKSGTAKYMVERPCKQCGKVMVVKSMGTRKIYCGDECRNKHLHPSKNCEECGKEFWPGKNQQFRFCCYKCSVEYKRKTSVLYGDCGWCGKPFKKRKESNAFCSKSCANKHRWAEKRKFESQSQPV